MNTLKEYVEMMGDLSPVILRHSVAIIDGYTWKTPPPKHLYENKRILVTPETYPDWKITSECLEVIGEPEKWAMPEYENDALLTLAVAEKWCCGDTKKDDLYQEAFELTSIFERPAKPIDTAIALVAAYYYYNQINKD